MGSNKQTEGEPRLYVRVEDETLKGWHRWARLRRLSMTGIVRSVFRKGRFPNIVAGWEIGLLKVELLRTKYEQRKIRNNLVQLVKVIENGTIVAGDGDLRMVQDALQRTNESIDATEQLLDKLYVSRVL